MEGSDFNWFNVAMAIFGSGGLGTAMIALYFEYRRRRRLGLVEDATAEIAIREKKNEADSEHLNGVIADMREQYRQQLEEVRADYRKDIAELKSDLSKMRKKADDLQDKTAEKILETNLKHQECERKFSALEQEVRGQNETISALRARVKELEESSWKDQ